MDTPKPSKPTAEQLLRSRIRRQNQRLQLSTNRALAIKLERLNQALEKGALAPVCRARAELARVVEEAEAAVNLGAQVLEFSQGEPHPAPAPAPAPAGPPAYCIASTTLAEALAYLTRRLPGTHGEPEWMLAVTGLKLGNLRTLENLIEVQLASQSAGQAAFDINDFTRIAVLLHEHGQALHAIFHSHRFKGMPHPSGVDNTLQRILEEGGYPAIQAVFSEDGYVQFFAHRPYTLEVHGKGVMCIDQQTGLYRIIQFDTLPHPANPAKNS